MHCWFLVHSITVISFCVAVSFRSTFHFITLASRYLPAAGLIYERIFYRDYYSPTEWTKKFVRRFRVGGKYTVRDYIFFRLVEIVKCSQVTEHVSRLMPSGKCRRVNITIVIVIMWKAEIFFSCWTTRSAIFPNNESRCSLYVTYLFLLSNFLWVPAYYRRCLLKEFLSLFSLFALRTRQDFSRSRFFSQKCLSFILFYIP